MATETLSIPLFDADNHLYETEESLTKYLPERYKGAIDYVEVRGRTKIVVRGQISEYIPNPTFEVVARPGAQEELLPRRQPRGEEPAGDLRRAHARHPRLPRARGPARAHGRAGHRPLPDVPHLGQPGRGADARRSRDDPRRHPLAQRVDARDLDLQLREPDLHHAGHHPAHRRAGHRGTRMGASSAGRRWS